MPPVIVDLTHYGHQTVHIDLEFRSFGPDAIFEFLSAKLSDHSSPSK